jgi:hypothetical protein
MKKSNLIILLFLLAVSCKKYEEGPLLSFRSAEKRLLGKWQVEMVSVNDANQTPAYLMLDLDEFSYNIFSDWSGKYYINAVDAQDHVVVQSPLSINKKKTEITFRMETVSPYESQAQRILDFFPPFIVENKWQILRLKNDELWISNICENGTYIIHFVIIADFTNY